MGTLVGLELRRQMSYPLVVSVSVFSAECEAAHLLTLGGEEVTWEMWGGKKSMTSLPGKVNSQQKPTG